MKGKKVPAAVRQSQELKRFCEEDLGNHPMAVAMAAQAMCGQTADNSMQYI